MASPTIFDLQPLPAAPAAQNGFDLDTRSFDPVLAGGGVEEEILVRAPLAPVAQDFRPGPGGDYPAQANAAFGSQLHGLFPCCRSAFQDGLDGQAGR